MISNTDITQFIYVQSLLDIVIVFAIYLLIKYKKDKWGV